MTNLSILNGAFDAHVHLAPDVVPRAQSAWEFARDAAAAAMSGAVLKDHCAPTTAVAAALNVAHPGGPRFIGSITLNPAVGGLNPSAVEAALRAGARVVWFPTYGACFQIERMGRAAMPFPMLADFSGLTVFDANGGLLPEVRDIIALIAAHDAVLATGHLSPAESLALIHAARAAGVRRIVVTHASEPVPAMSLDEQRAAVAAGAMIEHCLMACSAAWPQPLAHAAMAEQIRAVGVANVIISSDFGQPINGSPVAAFAQHLASLAGEGFSSAEIDVLVRANPRALFLQSA